MIERLEARAERRSSACGAGRLVWRAWGAGRPLVLLHGASGSWTHWLRNIEPLAARRRVLAPDMPGFGDSDAPPEPHTADGLADLVAAWLDAAVPPPTPLDLVGFSFGGIIAGLVAARAGGRVGTLVLLGPNGLGLARAPLPELRRPGPGRTADEAREAHRANLRALMLADPAAADDLAVRVQMDNVRRARFRSAGIPESDALLRALPRVRARLAGIWGSRDVFAAPYLDERRRCLAGFQPGLDFRVLEGVGHWAAWEAAPAVNAALLEILDGAATAR